MKRILALLILSSAVFAQNSDLGLLIGFSGPRSDVTAGPAVRVSSSVSAHGQINYAVQLKEMTAGRIYLELPLLIGGHVRSTVGNGVYASSGAIIYFTPGIRWNVPLHSRISVYGTAGGGLAGFGGNQAVVTANRVSTTNGFTASLAGAIGGGLDLRLSRLMSLRGEVRDFISSRGLDGTDSRHHVVFGFGVGFHW